MAFPKVGDRIKTSRHIFTYQKRRGRYVPGYTQDKEISIDYINLENSLAIKGKYTFKGPYGVDLVGNIEIGLSEIV